MGENKYMYMLSGTLGLSFYMGLLDVGCRKNHMLPRNRIHTLFVLYIKHSKEFSIYVFLWDI